MAVGERIRQARMAAGLSQRELAKRVGVSAAAISKYERGQDLPGSRVFLRLASELSVPLDFFFRKPRDISIRPSYRTHRSLDPKTEKVVETRVKEWLERYLEAEELVEPGPSVAFRVPEPVRTGVAAGEDIELIAEQLRNAWGLGAEPIENLIDVLEQRGIRVGVIPPVEGFDALSFTTGDEEPVIALAGGVPGDRARFSAAHELGHIIGLGEESAAQRFAGAFLAPRAAVIRELGWKRHALSLAELEILKHKYGLSMQGWLHRAAEVGIISESAYQEARREFRERGWEVREPGEPYPVEVPVRLRKLVFRALAEGVISQNHAAELLKEPIDDLEAVPR